MRIQTKILLLLVLLSACSKKKSQIEDLISDKITQIERKVTDLQRDIQLQQTEINFLGLRISLLEKSYSSFVTFDLTNPNGFHKVDCSVGFFYISAGSVEKYLDGYKASFLIGNPFAAIFDDITINVRWRDRSNKHKSEISLNEQLKSATWNEIKIFLSPVNSIEDLEKIDLSINVGSVKLINE